jgi:hypothetical protein
VKHGRIGGRRREVLEGFDVFMAFLKIQEAERVVESLPWQVLAQELPDAVNRQGASSLTPAHSHAQRERVNRLTARGGPGAVAQIAIASFLTWRHSHKPAWARGLPKSSHSSW